jgi:DNA repair protein RadD
LSSVGIKGGDYDTQKMGVKFAEICSDAVKDMRVKFEAYNIKTALIFASNIENAEMILSEWNDSETMRIVHGKMTEPERRAAIHWIKKGHGNRYIVNVGVLTTGFNHAALDCVVLMRATKSTGLYVQMVGRVLRAHDDKKKGYLIDYGTNIERLGRVDGGIKAKTHKKKGNAPTKLCL